ncbi:replication protein A 70 kDa DNA-binding subunit B-like isoform X2 [Silene latifolia]
MKDSRMCLSDLTTSSKKYSVKVKVIEKARPKCSAKNGILYQNLLLEDEKGIKMRGILFGEQIELYKDALVYSGVYEISNAPIKICQEEWRKGLTDLMHQMGFNHQTGIRPLNIGSGPIQPQYQNISQIPKVSNAADRYDIVGIVLFVEEEPHSITTKQGKDYTVRELAIVDHSTERPLLISAWNDLAHTECDLLLSKATKLQIVGFTALKITNHKGFSMATTMSTTFIHSPTGDKPTTLEDWRNRNQTKLT